MLLVSPFLHVKILLGLRAKGGPLLEDEVPGGRLNHLSSLPLLMPAIFSEFCPLCLAVWLTARKRRKRSELEGKARTPGRELEFHPMEKGGIVKTWPRLSKPAREHRVRTPELSGHVGLVAQLGASFLLCAMTMLTAPAAGVLGQLTESAHGRCRGERLARKRGCSYAPATRPRPGRLSPALPL